MDEFGFDLGATFFQCLARERLRAFDVTECHEHLTNVHATSRDQFLRPEFSILLQTILH
jgi:hypothetical protein